MRWRQARDAAALAAAALAAAIRVRRGGRLGLPRRTDDVTAAVLERLLAQAAPGLRVTAVDLGSRDSGTTDRMRIGVGYADAETARAFPSTFFVKLAPRHAGTRVFVAMMALGARETRFYRDLRPRLDVDAPRAYAAIADQSNGDFVLVLEDLVAAGCRFGSAAEQCTRETAEAVIDGFGRLHARFWDHRDLDGALAWMPSPTRHRRLGIELAVSRLGIAAALRRPDDVVPPEARAVAPVVLERRDALERAWSTPPLTVVHGDAHLGNAFFRDGHAGFFDWQVVQQAQGMRDVSYFLCNSVPVALRREHEDVLIRRYLAVLASQGVPAPSFDAVWEQHRLHAAYAWIAAMVTAGARTMQPDAVSRAGVARATAAMHDLGSLERLARLPG